MFGLGFLNILRDKKLWWVDVIFYFVISSLIATVICYVIFAIKISFEKTNAASIYEALKTVGTDEQKEMEKNVFEYQKKLNAFAPLVKNHLISSNLFVFLEQNTLPNVWFSRFSTAPGSGNIIVSGEAESVEVLSRQVAVLEQNNLFKDVTVLGTTISNEGRASFNLSITINTTIYTPLPTVVPQQNILQTESDATSPAITPQAI